MSVASGVFGASIGDRARPDEGAPPLFWRLLRRSAGRTLVAGLFLLLVLPDARLAVGLAWLAFPLTWLEHTGAVVGWSLQRRAALSFLLAFVGALSVVVQARTGHSSRSVDEALHTLWRCDPRLLAAPTGLALAVGIQAVVSSWRLWAGAQVGLTLLSFVGAGFGAMLLSAGLIPDRAAGELFGCLSGGLLVVLLGWRFSDWIERALCPLDPDEPCPPGAPLTPDAAATASGKPWGGALAPEPFPRAAASNGLDALLLSACFLVVLAAPIAERWRELGQ